ncbi:MAG: DUF4249 domain-containing protein [Candidatus Marinimicrobia bacterium]|nr:DUF4249 domain-containing protein [Candidatus Neomarinimicrobiota bacterium]MCF7828535.1 DUF4249 domain-containing protein [Candidatus Neomarinimicrobiota bacterium]MCF7882042.1 DUF4249 domain-containing protein [Candidatus Neomarinimicrobiota bacterium]
MNFKDVFQGLAIAAIFLLISCWGWQEESITTPNYEPALNVMAVISPDTTLIRVMRTMPLSGPTMQVDTIENYWSEYGVDEDLIVRTSYYEVMDAEVRISGANRTFTFQLKDQEPEPHEYRRLDDSIHVYYPSSFNPRAIYKDTTGVFTPQPGQTYSLSVYSPSLDLSVTGQTTMPEPGRLHHNAMPDSFRGDRTFRMIWFPGSTPYYQLSTVPQADGFCGAHNLYLVDEDTTVLMIPAPSCAGKEMAIDSVTYLMVDLVTMDANYHRYFNELPEEGDDFESFVMENVQSGYQVGIQGGYGIFGSVVVARDSIPVKRYWGN